MILAILVAVCALVIASLVGALLAPSDYSTGQAILHSRWPTHPHGLPHD
jgi:hypothetical protein